MTWETDRNLVLGRLEELKTSLGSLTDAHHLAREEVRDRLDLVKSESADEMNRLKVRVAVLETKMLLICGGISAITSLVTALVVSFTRGD